MNRVVCSYQNIVATLLLIVDAPENESEIVRKYVGDCVYGSKVPALGCPRRKPLVCLSDRELISCHTVGEDSERAGYWNIVFSCEGSTC